MSGGGFGSVPFGGGPYGGPVVPFGVATVTAVDYRTIEITFTSDLASNLANLMVIGSVGSYAITPYVGVQAAVLVSANRLRVYTLPQSPGATYRIEIIGDLRDVWNQALGNRVGTWVGLAAEPKYLVSNLEARAECQGLSVYLKWQNPEGRTSLKIVRRLKAWPFDLTDSHDVVYESNTLIEEFVDTGVAHPVQALTSGASAGDSQLVVPSVSDLNVGDSIRVEKLTGSRQFEIHTIASFTGMTQINLSAPLANNYAVGDRCSKSTPLLPQTYYYYLVLVNNEDSLYDIDDPSRVMGLSIEPFDGKGWFTAQEARYTLELDAKPEEEGGGGGFLDKWFTVMGCWLARMRGELNALKLTADPDQAPFHVLTAKNQSLGIDPEGFAFDFDIVRRPLTSLIYVYKRKGTCPGIVETVRMFTKWDAECREFGFNQCAGGAASVKTWDGVSQLDQSIETGSDPFVIEVIDAEGTGRITDPTKTWGDDLWKDGTIRGALGDVVCVDTNADNVITTKAPPLVTRISTNHSAGVNSFQLLSTAGIYPGMTLQLISNEETSPGSGVYGSEIVEVLTVTGGVITTHGAPSTYAYPDGSKVTIGKSIFRRSFAGEATAAGQILTDADALWTDHQWKGYKARSTGVTRNITESTGTALTVDGTAPSSGNYVIAKDFDGSDPLAAYIIGNGVHSAWFEPTLDLEARGTVYDPFNRLYNGPGLPLSGAYGPQDIAAYITTEVVVAKGRAQGVTGFVFDLDPNEEAPSVNEWKGWHLNPNQNQDQMFEILENDATTLTIAGEVQSLVVEGQYYYVLKPRDKVRFQRLSRRLRTEFTDTDVRVRVLFV